MAKKTKNNKKPVLAHTQDQLNDFSWLNKAAFISAGLLIFYPPFIQGLYFSQDMFLYHIVTGVVFALVWIDKLTRQDYRFFQTPLDWAVLAYAGAYLLSLIGAVHPGEAIYGFLRALNYFMVYWVVSQVCSNYRDYLKILIILLAAGVGVAGIGILAATGLVSIEGAFTGGLIKSTLQYHNTMAAYLAVLSLIGISLWIRETKPIQRAVYLLISYIFMVVTFSTISKGAWLIFGIGGILLLAGMPGKYRLKTVYGMGVSMLVAFMISSRFLPCVTGQNPAQGLWWISLGILLVALAQAVWEGLIYFYHHKKINRVAAAVLLVVILAGCAAFLAQSSIRLPDNMSEEMTQLIDRKDFSYVSRSDFMRWGFEIVKDYPLLGTGAGGWNALYHQYQDTLYWTREVHNHFMQVWVEAGTIGLLAFISIWLMGAWAVLKRYRARRTAVKEQQDVEARTDQWILTWGTAVAALSLGFHAAFDFDLSMPAIAILLWTLFALLNSEEKAEECIAAENKGIPGLKLVLAAIMSFIMLLTGSMYLAAYNKAQYGQTVAERAVTAKDRNQQIALMNLAEKTYLQVVSLDPTNGMYHANLASVYALEYRYRGDKQYFGKATQEIEKAEELSPYDISIRSALLKSSQAIQDIGIFIRQTEASLQANPNDIHNYEAVAKAMWTGVQYYSQRGKADKADYYAARILLIEERIEMQKNRLNPDRVYWQGDPLEITPLINLNLAKAEYYSENYKSAAALLNGLNTQPAEKLKNIDLKEIKPWYAAALHGLEEREKEQAILEQLDEEQQSIYQEILSMPSHSQKE